MKLSNLALAFAVTVSGAFASAQLVEPGPEMKLEYPSMDAVDALLMAKKADLEAYTKSGNTTKEITVQNIYPSSTVYKFTRQQCNQGGVAGGVCLGGSRLTVMLTTKQMGSAFRTEAKSSLVSIK